MIQTKKSFRFQCTECGHCCTGSSRTHYIEVRPEEKEAIRKYLGISDRWFQRRYLTPVTEDMEGLRIDAVGNCAFLDKDKRCRVYAVRPLQCKSYPFWPEIISSDRSWKKEQKFCEGINRGQSISRRRVQQWLRLLEDEDWL